jgi:late competence protein required for DNA uptake (superfamily II DNA/RNA helicase)
MKFECHRCKKEIEQIEEMNFYMDENGFTYTYCKECINIIKKEKNQP